MGTPLSEASQVAEKKGVIPDSGITPFRFSDNGAYRSYALPKCGEENSKKTSADALSFIGNRHERVVPLRSKTVKIKPVLNRSGTRSFRVTGTLNGKQRKQTCQNLDDAVAIQEAWEQERLQLGAANRPKITTLTKTQLREAETAFGLLESEGIGLLDMIKDWIRRPKPATNPNVTLIELYDAFIKDRADDVGRAQFATLRQHCGSFVRTLGCSILISDITAGMIEGWLENKGTAKKTWNNCRGSVSTMFNWAVHPRRCWLIQNPVMLVKRHTKRSMPVQKREILSVKTCKLLMEHLETDHPQWCLSFALALFAGVRPDRTNGELAKLSRGVERDGTERFFYDKILYLAPEMVKAGPDRETDIPGNLSKWIECYPPTPEALCPQDSTAYARIRKRFKIPHDGLRHTAITAFLAAGATIAEAARQFGNSENMIRDHYRGRMDAKEAKLFYEIYPNENS